MEFRKAIDYCIAKEGGFSNDPDDAGNWTGGIVNGRGVGVLKGTKKGISAKSYPHLDIRNLTDAEILNIYHRDFWNEVKADSLPAAIRLHVLDFAITSGVSTAVKALQQAAGFTKSSDVDGRIGAQTIAASVRVNPWDYQAQRRRFYVAITRTDLVKLKYLSGWLDRNESITRICLGA